MITSMVILALTAYNCARWSGDEIYRLLGDSAEATDILAVISYGHLVLAPKDRGAFSRFSERHRTAPGTSCLATPARTPPWHH